MSTPFCSQLVAAVARNLCKYQRPANRMLLARQPLPRRAMPAIQHGLQGNLFQVSKQMSLRIIVVVRKCKVVFRVLVVPLLQFVYQHVRQRDCTLFIVLGLETSVRLRPDVPQPVTQIDVGPCSEGNFLFTGRGAKKESEHDPLFGVAFGEETDQILLLVHLHFFLGELGPISGS